MIPLLSARLATTRLVLIAPPAGTDVINGARKQASQHDHNTTMQMNLLCSTLKAKTPLEQTN